MTPESAAASNEAARKSGWYTANWNQAKAAQAALKRPSALARVWPHVSDEWQRRIDIINAAKIATGDDTNAISNGIASGLAKGAIELDRQAGNVAFYRRAPGAELDPVKERMA